MVIREANEADMRVLADLVRSSFCDVAERFGLTVENCPRFVGFCAEERVQSDFEKGLSYYILEQDSQPCGCVALEKAGPDVCYLKRLAVVPELRKKGMGTALVNHIFDRARRIGARRVEIGMISKDSKLKNWYRKFGFVENGTKKFDHLPFMVAFMYKEL